MINFIRPVVVIKSRQKPDLYGDEMEKIMKKIFFLENYFFKHYNANNRKRPIGSLPFMQWGVPGICYIT